MLGDNTGGFCWRKTETPVSRATEALTIHAAMCFDNKILLVGIVQKKKENKDLKSCIY